MNTMQLPQGGYTIREAEKLLNLSEKQLYKLIREKKVNGYVDSVGQLRISREEAYAYIRQREEAMS